MNTWEWVFPALVAAGSIGVVGLVVQQVFLRWNQGQELRQALITIAISVIIADQVHRPLQRRDRRRASPGRAGPTGSSSSRSSGSTTRSRASLVLFLGVAVGRRALGLALPHAHGDGDPGRRRRPADDLGARVNIQLVFAIAFVVGSALAAFGGVVGASQGAVAPGQDGQWLLNSLVVVIIGGMGSLLGAAAGSLLYGLVFSFSAVYLPTTGDNCCTQYSIVVTFVLLALVLAFRPQGLFGRDAMMLATPKQTTERAIGVGALVARRARPGALQRLLGRRHPHADVHRRDRRGEPDLPRGVRRHGLARADALMGSPAS